MDERDVGSSGPDGDALEPILEALRAGSVVGLPTDTVYGLGARLERRAVERIFAAKGRPLDLALPVLIGQREQVDLVAAAFPVAASILADRFWPGPLTVVVSAKRAVGTLLGGDRRTVGIRWPDDPLLEQVCLAVGPLAVTSANRHGEPPCTSGVQTRATFSLSEVAVVLDAGSRAGVPSTVVDCVRRPPRCVREGAVPWTEIEAALA